MALTKPPVLPPWAEAGDKVQPTNGEIQTGWPLSNTPPARQRWNWILNFLANGVRYLTRRGLPDYGADETYMVGDRVIGDDGKTYRSIQDNNINHAPSASPLWWEEWAPSLSRLADLLQKQTYTAFTTAGAAPNFTLMPAPALTAYTTGQRFRVKFHAAGSGADVLNISGLGDKSLKQYDSTGAKVAAVITANQLADVEYDGIDLVLINPLPAATGVTPPQFDNDTSVATTAFVQRALGNRRAYSVPAFGPIAAAEAGKTLGLSAAGTYTLPAAADVPFGAAFEFVSTSSGTVVQAAGADVIILNGVSTPTSVALNNGDTLVLVKAGATSWIAVSGSAQLGKSAAFGSSLAANGYQKLPSGLIFQWVRGATLGAASSGLITLPIAFPNGILSEYATQANGVDLAPNFANFSTWKFSTSQVKVYCSSASGPLFDLFVIGY